LFNKFDLNQRPTTNNMLGIKHMGEDMIAPWGDKRTA